MRRTIAAGLRSGAHYLMVNLLKNYWRRWNVRRHRGGDPRAMERLYLLEDPWGLKSAEESFRFAETVRIIRDRIGNHFGTILEIGCGEGLQTKHFAPLADSIVGIDPSVHAVNRARGLGIKNAVFETGDLVSFRRSEGGRFDLVTACEVIYYLDDVETVYKRLNEMGSTCLVTYYRGVCERFDPFFKMKAAESETVRGRLQEWRVVWWRNP